MNIFSAKKVLVIAAHPDDEVLGAGGTIAALSQRGTRVETVFVASGITGRNAKLNPKENLTEIDELKANAEGAAKILGVAKCHFLNLPDNRLDTISRADIAHAIKEIQFSFSPDLVFTHHHADYNWDHTVVFDATLMACRINPGDPSPSALLSFEVPSSTERAFQNPSNVFCPTAFFDIKDTLQKKISAMNCYESEKRSFPHPRSSLALETLAQKRGIEVGLEAAEAFQVIRSVHTFNS